MAYWCHVNITYGCESWAIICKVISLQLRYINLKNSKRRERAECRRIDAFKLWCWRRLLRVPWTARRSSQSILKDSVLNIHQKDWCWSWNSNTLSTWWEELTHWKRPWCWERLKAGGEGKTEDEMVGWHHRLDGREFEPAPGVGDRREAWCASVHGVAKGRTWLSNRTEVMGSEESLGLLAQADVVKLTWKQD